MKVVATQKGYFGQVREPGDEFEVPDGAKASWFEPVKRLEKAEPAKSVKQAGKQ